MDGQVDAALASVSDMLYSWGLMWLLIGAGIFFTVRTRAVQLRHTDAIAASVVGSRDGSHGGITSFQAFAVGLACRVGTGNIVGVALALIMGGPGAVLWMWLVAILGTATAFSEATLAQLFKVRRPDGTFRGGPAYYISRGLGRPILGGVFAVVFLIANGLVMPMVQANAITASLQGAGGLSPSLGAVLVVALTAPVLLGGLRAMARVAEYLAPLMALAYLVLVLAILLTHPVQAWEALRSIIEGAFGLRQGLGGLAGGVTAALLNGVRRGLFSNEAGLGGAACAAGSATVSHPVQQGFIQAFGVVVDTLFVCTATALAILVAGADVLHPGASAKESAGTLTQDAIAHLVGSGAAGPWRCSSLSWPTPPSSGPSPTPRSASTTSPTVPGSRVRSRFGAVICAGVGSVQQLTTVWTLADVLLGLGAIINLVALVILSRWVVGALRDWEARRGSTASDGGQLVFRGDSEYLPAPLPEGAWEGSRDR